MSAPNKRNPVWDITGIILSGIPLWVQGIWTLYSSQPLIPCLQKMGVPMISLLWLTVPAGLIFLFIRHREKAVVQTRFTFEQFPKNAPGIMWGLVLVFFLIFLRGCNLSSENDRLTQQLSDATNSSPKKVEQIKLKDEDYAVLTNALRQGFNDFTNTTGGRKPRVFFALPNTAKQSDILFRQIKDASHQFGWDDQWENPASTKTEIPGAWVYNLSVATWQSSFWISTLKNCHIYMNDGGKWPGKWPENTEIDDVVIVINDPKYLKE